MQASIDVGAEQVAARSSSLYERFAQLLSRPHAKLWIAAAVFVMSLPAISIGLAADDFDLALAVTQAPLSGYAFQSRDPVVRHAQLLAARDAGVTPWWSALDFHQSFFRPLSSLSLALDFTLWPSAPWLMHLENGLIFALTALLAASIYKALGLPARACGIATLFYAVHGGSSSSTGWISSRNTLLIALFGFLSIRLFIAARSGWRSIPAVLAFTCALASGEGGVAAIAYMVAYALSFGDAPAPEAKLLQRVPVVPAPLPRLIAMLAGFGVVIAAWFALYKSGGYGAHNAGFYVDPLREPGRFLIGLAAAIPIYLASQLTVPFASFSVVAPLAVITGLALLVLYVSRRLWLPWVRHDARGRTLGLGALLCIFPLGASPPQDRLAGFVALGMSGLCALIVEERLSSASELPQRGALRLLRLHTIWAPLVYFPFLFSALGMITGGGARLLDRKLGADERPVILVNAPSPLPSHYMQQKRRWFAEPSPTVDLLYAGASALEIERSSEQSLTLTAARGYFVGPLESFGRNVAKEPMHVGEVIDTRRMRVQVLAVQGGAPKRVRFDFVLPLGDVRVYAWQGREPELLPLPKIGERVQLKAAATM